MKFQQIRNATIKITYAGKTFLIDPWLTPRFLTGSFAVLPLISRAALRDPRKRAVAEHCLSMRVSSAKALLRFLPLTPLPLPVKEINCGVDAYLATHLHGDHLGLNPNLTVCHRLDRTIPIYAQNKEDADYMRLSGMKDVRIIEDKLAWGGAELIKVPATHGSKAPCGEACGYVFRAPDEKTLYVCGDTIWCPEVEETIKKYKPEVIITNNCAAQFKDYGRLIMDDNDLYEVWKAAPNATIIASHMDAVTHATLTRKTLRDKLADKGINQFILMPEDGERYKF